MFSTKLKQYFLMAATMILVLSFTACSDTSEEQVEVGAWKDKLIEADDSNAINDTLTDINGTIQDTTALLGEKAEQGQGKLTEIGNSISDTIKGWADMDLSYLTATPLPATTEPPSHTDTSTEVETNSDGTRIKVKFLKVVDGDTIYVEYNGEKTRVRLIGINTAESVAPEEYLQATGKENTQEGKFASDYLKELMKDVSEVWLEFDLELNDDYGRLLAYVWLDGENTDAESNMLNIILVKSGWAEPMTIQPNVKYEDDIARASETEG